MLEDTLRSIVRKKVIEILEAKLGREIAEEIEKKLSYEERGRILKEYEKNKKLSEETYNYVLSKYYYRDLTSVLFGISSEIRVYPEITGSMIGSGKFGVVGLRKHIRELGYSDDKFEEVLQAIYVEIEKLARSPKYLELFAVASLEIGNFYLEQDCGKAEEYLSKAYELRSNIHDVQKLKKLLEGFLRLSSFYCRVKKMEKAKIMYERANNLVKELGNKLDASTSKLLREVNEKLGEL
ncbi:MAG: hypothetical protein QXN27_03820 [Archaeoglobaceae archaeon]|uniref:Tetratricopeptide repeat protein n=1 Tax=Archaeoglobus fulgidus TaxID=2234 RepID=A0A7J3M470_ARCFL